MRLSKKDVENAGDLSIGRLLGFKWIVYSVFRVNQYQISIRIFAERVFLIEDGALKPSILKPWHSVVQPVDQKACVLADIAISKGNGGLNVFNGALRGAGDTLFPMAVSITCLWLIRIPLAYWFSSIWGRSGIWWAIGASLCIGFTITYIYYKFGFWKNKGPLRKK